jgi:hypothetical protein
LLVFVRVLAPARGGVAPLGRDDPDGEDRTDETQQAQEEGADVVLSHGCLASSGAEPLVPLSIGKCRACAA